MKLKLLALCLGGCLGLQAFNITGIITKLPSQPVFKGCYIYSHFYFFGCFWYYSWVPYCCGCRCACNAADCKRNNIGKLGTERSRVTRFTISSTDF